MKLRVAALALLIILWTGPALAQGCAMCYSSAAAGASKDGQRAISRAVLVLLVPPVAFMTVGMGLAFRYGKKRDKDTDQESVLSTEVSEELRDPERNEGSLNFGDTTVSGD